MEAMRHHHGVIMVIFAKPVLGLLVIIIMMKHIGAKFMGKVTHLVLENFVF
jgi:hypothetical protein